MLDSLETLTLLTELRTMGRVATRLRVTQSAVSKRVAMLEAALGVKLVERDGRHVRLTPTGLELVGRASPLLAELRATLAGERHLERGRIVLGVSESILTSWGPAVLAEVQKQQPEVELLLHTHRSPVAIDGVRSGELHLALVAGSVERGDGRGDGMGREHVLDEELVLLGLSAAAKALVTASHGRSKRKASVAVQDARELPVLSIERSSDTYRALAPQLRALRARGIALTVDRELQSFAAIVQLARQGLGPALVPWPLARALGVTRAQVVALPEPGLKRPVVLVARKTTWSRPLIARFASAVQEVAKRRVTRASERSEDAR